MKKYYQRQVTIKKAGRENFPEKLLKNIRYVDPVIWPGLLGVYKLMQFEDIIEETEEVGVILCGRAYPQTTSARVLYDVSNRLSVSPFHFTAANAAATISIICTTFRFHGPTINLCMPVLEAEPIVESIIRHWFYHGTKSVFVIKQDQIAEAQVAWMMALKKNIASGINYAELP